MDRLNSQQHRANMAAIHSKDNKAGDGDAPLFAGTWVSFSVKSCTVVWRTRHRNAGVLYGLSSIAIMSLYLFGNFEQLNLIEEKEMRYTFCPTLLEKYEHPWTNGLSKASVSIGKTCSLYIRMRTRLSVLRSLVPIARIAFSMSVEHDAMGKLKKVLIFVLPRHIV